MSKAKRFGIRGLPVVFFKERKTFIAYSPALDLSSSGTTMLQAKKNFVAMLDLLLEELVAHGTLDQFLMEMGWLKRKKEWQSPVEMQTSVIVPFRLPVAV